MRCLVNDKHCHGDTDGDHIKTFGSGGADCHENMWPLCRMHHAEKGQIGTQTFISKYGDRTIPILKAKGWEFDSFMKKWINKINTIDYVK